jgi:hypothetical protein
MKTKDVIVGQTYLARIGTELARVVVIAKVTDYKDRVKFQVRRESERSPLPKARSAAALREFRRSAAIVADKDRGVIVADFSDDKLTVAEFIAECELKGNRDA